MGNLTANKRDITEWFKEGMVKGRTYMIVVCDTFDYHDYPVYVGQYENVRDVVKECTAGSMQRVEEVYDLRKDMDKQLAKEICWDEGVTGPPKTERIMVETGIPKEMKIGRIKFERGDTVLVQYSPARTTGELLARLKERLPREFPGVRIVFVPDIIKIDCLHFKDVSVTVNIKEKQA